MKVDGWGLYEGSTADLTLIDPEREWTFQVEKSRSLSRNSPFDGRTMKGKAMVTVVGGKVVHEEAR